MKKKYSIDLKFYLFMILIHLTRIKLVHNSTTNLKCVNAEINLFSHQTYCLEDCEPPNSSLKSNLVYKNTPDEFEAACKKDEVNKLSIQTSNQINQVSLNTNIKYFSSPSSSSSKRACTHVFVFDFLIITGDVFIDFKNLNLSYLRSKYNASSTDSSTLVLYFVTRQFVTFRLLNTPFKKNEYLTSIKILINGESSLDIMQQYGDLSIDVLHAPLYDSSSDRVEFLHYLNQIFDRDYDYVEYLSMFCRIKHIQIDLNKLIDARLEYDIEQQENINNIIVRSDLVEALYIFAESDDLEHPAITEYYLLKKCTLLNLNQHMSDSEYSVYLEQDQIYLYEIEQPDQLVHQDANYLRFYIKECSENKEYILVFYVKPSSSKNMKKLILDDPYTSCTFKIFSNTDIYDLNDVKYEVTRLEEKNSNLYDYEENDYELKDLDSNYESFSVQDRRKRIDLEPALSETNITETNPKERLAKLLQKNYKLRFNSFFYLRIIPNANEIEFRFYTDPWKGDIASNKFFNKLSPQLFLDTNEQFYKQITQNYPVVSESVANYSVKFVLSEADLLDYFKDRSLNLTKFMHKGAQDAKDLSQAKSSEDFRYFFLTNKSCRAIFLHSDLKLQADVFLLLFNSKMYDSNEYSCFYFENLTNTFYLTFGYSFNHDKHMNTIYLPLKQQIDKNELTPSTPNKIYKQSQNQIEIKREKSINDYFSIILFNTIRSNYLVETNRINSMLSYETTQRIIRENEKSKRLESAEIKPKAYNYVFGSVITLFSLDDSISWSLDKCWLDENVCHDLIDHSSFFYPQNSLIRHPDDDADEEYEGVEVNEQSQNQNDNLYDWQEVHEDYGSGRLLSNNLNETLSNETLDEFKKWRQDRITSHPISPLNYTILDYISKITLKNSNNIYEHRISLKIKFLDLSNIQGQKKVILCSLKPYPTCNYSQYRHKYYNRRQIQNNPEKNKKTCDKNSKLMKFFDRVDTSNKVKTILLTKFNSSSPALILESLKYDSAKDGSKIKLKCQPNTKTTFILPPATNTTNPSTKTSSTQVPKTTSQKEILFDWLSSNKLTLALVAICLLFSLLCLVMIKLLANNYKCHNFNFFGRRSERRSNRNRNVNRTNNKNNNNNRNHVIYRTNSLSDHQSPINNKNLAISQYDESNEQQLRLLNHVPNDNNNRHYPAARKNLLFNGNNSRITNV